MAYGFGTTVNPQLGAVDYSNYLRGALAGAQMQAQGGAAIGAGVQNALANIEQGIQGFQKRQKENSILTGQIGAMAQQAGVGEFLDEKNKKLLNEFIDPEKELNNKKLSQLMASLSVASAENQKNQENAQKAMELQLEIDNAMFDREEAKRRYNLDSSVAANNMAMQGFNAGLDARRFDLDSSVAANNMAMQGVNAGLDARRIDQADRKLNLEAQRFQAQGDVAPTGMRWVDKEKTKLEPIPGGVIDYERKMNTIMAEEQALEIANNKERQIEAANTILGELNDVQVVIDNAQKLLEHGSLTSGFGGAISKYYFGGDANTLNAMYSQIRSQVVLKTLTQLKTLSKTGATGFGQMNEKEFAALENRFGELATSKSEAQQQRVLEQIYNGLEDLKRGIKMDLPSEDSEATQLARKIVGIK